DAIERSPTCALSAIVDRSPAAQARAEMCGAPRSPSLNALFSADKPDGGVLATPNQLHVAQALTCIAANVPMLLEKPIAPTVAEAEALVRAADAAQAKVLIGHHRAHSPVMAKAKAVIETG